MFGVIQVSKQPFKGLGQSNRFQNQDGCINQRQTHVSDPLKQQKRAKGKVGVSGVKNTVFRHKRVIHVVSWSHRDEKVFE